MAQALGPGGHIDSCEIDSDFAAFAVTGLPRWKIRRHRRPLSSNARAFASLEKLANGPGFSTMPLFDFIVTPIKRTMQIISAKPWPCSKLLGGLMMVR